MSFKLAFIGCDQQFYNCAAENIIATPGVKGVFLQGDTPYVDNNAWRWQGAAAPKDLATDADGDSEANFKTHYDEYWANPGIVKLVASGIPIYMQPDDHEWMGNNWDGTITQADDTVSGLNGSGPASSQAEVDAHWVNGATAWRAARDLHANNPVNTDIGANTETPSEQVNNSASDYPVIYWRQAYTADGSITTDLSQALVQIYVLDCISYRGPVASAATEEIIGTQQHDWLIAQMQAAHDAGVTFQLLISSKNWYQTSGGNPDGWAAYSGARTNVIEAIDGTDTPSKVITGVAMIANDTHIPFVTYAAASYFSNMCVGSINQKVGAAGAAGGDEIFKATFNNNDWVHMTHGLIEFTPDNMFGSIMLAGSNIELFKYKVPSGSNVATEV